MNFTDSGNTKYNANIVMYVLKQEYKLEKTLEIY